MILLLNLRHIMVQICTKVEGSLIIVINTRKLPVGIVFDLIRFEHQFICFKIQLQELSM